MKKSDIAMIILIASISMVVAYFVVQSLPMFQKTNEPQQVKTFEEIKPDAEEPNPDVFNTAAINPTVEVLIGGGESSQPETPAENTPSDEQAGQ